MGRWAVGNSKPSGAPADWAKSLRHVRGRDTLDFVFVGIALADWPPPHTHVDGRYLMKDRGKPHFEKYTKGVETHELEAGIRRRASYLGRA